MNNHEWLLQQHDLKELGHELCYMTDLEKQDCELCPCSNYCSLGQNGYIKWLEKEHDDYGKKR